MIVINVKVINPDADTKDFFKDKFKFDLDKDIKNTQISENDFESILNDLKFYVNAKPRSGYKINGKDEISIFKKRFKDEKRNIGASSAYRLLYMVDDLEKICIPFHIYHKTSGKKPKLDLTEKEKKNIKKIIDDILKEKKG